MSVRLSQFAMVAIPLSRHLIDEDDEGLSRWDCSVGQIGVLNDGMSGRFCWFGLVLGHLTVPDWQNADDFSVPPVSSQSLAQAECIVALKYREVYGDPPEPPRLVIVNSWG